MDIEDKKQLNLSKLKHLIDSGISSIPVDKAHNNAVLVIGDTGVGKTTILSFLAKRKLYIKTFGLNTILDSDDSDGLKIGHDRFSETRVPAKIIIDRMVFFDCSGFKDNRGEEFEISNSFFVQRLFNIYKNIKILLIIDESSVSQARADKLPKLLRNLLKSFNTLTDIQDGVILLINRAKLEYSEKVYNEELLKMAKLKGENGYLFNEEERNFLQFLVNNHKVCLFKQAQKQDEGKVLDVKEENLLNLIKDANFVKSKKIKNIISESAKLSIRDFVDRVSIDSEQKITKLSQEIVKQFAYQSKTSSENAIEAAKQTKKKIANFAAEIQKASDEQIIQVIRSSVDVDLSAFEQDISAVLFFKNIYNKSDYFFKLVRSSIASNITKLVLDLDSQIAYLQEQQAKIKRLRDEQAAAENLAKSLQDELKQLKSKHEQFENSAKISKQTYAKQVGEISEKLNSKNNQFNALNEEYQKLNNAFLKKKEDSQLNQKREKEIQKNLEAKQKQIDELNALFESIKLESVSNSEEIEMLKIQNSSLKHQLDQVMSQKDNLSQASDLSSLNSSTWSKSSKYPDIICPHFKNGGQCVHCIKAWKAQQKKKSKQQI